MFIKLFYKKTFLTKDSWERKKYYIVIVKISNLIEDKQIWFELMFLTKIYSEGLGVKASKACGIKDRR